MRLVFGGGGELVFGSLIFVFFRLARRRVRRGGRYVIRIFDRPCYHARCTCGAALGRNKTTNYALVFGV